MKDVEIRRAGSAYIYRWPPPEPVEIEVDQVRQSSDDWKAYITVRYRSEGVKPHLFEGSHNLSALQGRTALAKHLAGMVAIDWPAFLEYACVSTIHAEREGDPFIRVGSLAAEDTRPFWLIEPVVRVGLPTIFFGDGGAGKSTTALMLASTLLAGEEIAGFRPQWTAPVLYLDWETDKEEINDTLKALRTGHRIDIPDIFYRRENWPLHQTVRQIKRFIDTEGIVLTVVDSIGAACGGEPESAEVTLRFFQAIRTLGCAALCISHIAKTGANGKPFGSAYMHNAARLTFELRRHQLPEESEMHIGLYHQKANKGQMQRPVGLAVKFGEEAITFNREQLPDVEELNRGLPLRDRILRALIGGAMSGDDVAEVVGESATQVYVTLSRLKKAGKVTQPERGKWGLVYAKPEAVG